MARVDCDIVFNSIVDRETAEDAHLRLSRPYTTSGVAIALRPGLEGIKGFGDLKKEQRVAAIVGSLARVKLGQKGLQTIPFTFEDETRADHGANHSLGVFKGAEFIGFARSYQIWSDDLSSVTFPTQRLGKFIEL